MSLSTASPLLKAESLTAGCSQLCPVRFCIPPTMEVIQTFWETAKCLTIPTTEKKKKTKSGVSHITICAHCLFFHREPLRESFSELYILNQFFLFCKYKVRRVPPFVTSLTTCVRKQSLVHSINLLDHWIFSDVPPSVIVVAEVPLRATGPGNLRLLPVSEVIIYFFLIDASGARGDFTGQALQQTCLCM